MIFGVAAAAPLADLVRAPAGEVDAPVVQPQLNVSSSVSTIKPHKTALRDEKTASGDEADTKTKSRRCYLPLSGGGDGSHVEQLPCVILNSAQHDDGDGVALLLDGPQDVLCP